MPRMSDSLHIPAGLTIPAELEQAWQWMEEQGWGLSNQHGYFLTPYAGNQQVGVVFDSTKTLEGWFEPDSPATSRLLPLAELAGDGTMGALWLTDDGETRFVLLGSEGDRHVLTASAVDFLRLCAVGYREVVARCLGEGPDEAETVEAHAPFRDWVEATFGEPVPSAWPRLDTDDEFTAWVRRQLGEDQPEVVVPDGPPADAVTGDAGVFLAALGTPDGTQRLVDHLGLPDGSGKTLKDAGLKVVLRRGLATIWLTLDRYPRPEQLLEGLDTSSMARVVEALGEPERQGEYDGEQWVRYAIGGRWLRFGFAGGAGLTSLTFMTNAPG